MVALAVTAAVMVVWTVLDLALAYGRYGMASRVLLAAAGAVAMGSLTIVATRATGVPTPITLSGTVAMLVLMLLVRRRLGGSAGASPPDAAGR